MRMRFKLPLLILFGSLCLCRAFAQDIHFSLVDPPKEASFSSIFGITQDREGYLWIATLNGLYKYDGHQYTLYLHNPSNANSLAINRVETVFADKDGIIWIATFGAGFDRL